MDINITIKGVPDKFKETLSQVINDYMSDGKDAQAAFDMSNSIPIVIQFDKLPAIHDAADLLSYIVTSTIALGAMIKK